MFRLFVAGTAVHVLSAPYFHGFLIDKHDATEIRGRLFPAPLIQVALFLGACSLLLLALLVAKGIVVSAAWMIPAATGAICLGVIAAGWRIGVQQSQLIAASIEKAFIAHRLTGD